MATTSSNESSPESSPPMHSRRRIQITSSESLRSGSRSPVVRRNRPPAYDHISYDKKNILIKCYANGKTVNESAKLAGINKNTAKSIINQYNKDGGVLIERQRGGRRNVKLNAVLLNKIERIIEENPSITLKGICDKILESEHVKLSISSIRNGLNRLQITLKYMSFQVDLQDSRRKIKERKAHILNFSRDTLKAKQKILLINESEFNRHVRRTKVRSKVM